MKNAPLFISLYAIYILGIVAGILISNDHLIHAAIIGFIAGIVIFLVYNHQNKTTI